MRELKFKFLKGSNPVFPLKKELNKPKESIFLKIEAQFLDEILELDIFKLLEFVTYYALTMKVKFEETKYFKVIMIQLA